MGGLFIRRKMAPVPPLGALQASGSSNASPYRSHRRRGLTPATMLAGASSAKRID